MKEYKAKITKKQEEEILHSHNLIAEIIGMYLPNIIKIDGYKVWFYDGFEDFYKWDWVYVSTILKKLGYKKCLNQK